MYGVERATQNYLDPLCTEIDNHADTTCAGQNCRIESYTGEVCSVSPFLDDNLELEDVKICTALTAATLPDTGETIILRMGQCLDFTDKLRKTLINPNQLRAYNTPVCDDPIDPTRQLGIKLGDDLYLPMQMYGTICGLMTRYPTNEEIYNCRIYTISSEDNWDPSSVIFSKLDGNCNRYSVISSLSICNSKAVVPYDVSYSNISAESLIPFFDGLQISAIVTDERHHVVSPEALAEKWGCSIQTTKSTLDVTTQMNIRSAVHPLTHRYRTDLLSQRLRRLDTTMYTDTLFAKSRSLIGNTCAQLFYDPCGFMYVFPMVSKGEAGESLNALTSDVGIPNRLVYDGAAEQVRPKSKFEKLHHHYHIMEHRTEPYSPWQNRAESGIWIVKNKWKHLMTSRSVPICLWDFALSWIYQIYSTTSTKEGQTGMDIVTGDTPDISQWLDFTFYDWAWYWHPPDTSSIPHIGRWLGVSHRVGSALCYWILTENGYVVARTTVQHVTIEKLSTDDVKEKMNYYSSSVSRFLGNSEYTSDLDGYIVLANDDEEAEEVDVDPEFAVPDIDHIVSNSDAEQDADTYHSYIGAEVVVPDAAGNRRMARVIRQVDNDVTNRTTNPLLDTTPFEVEFYDGTVERLTAKIIAENIMLQVDEYGHHYQVLKEIREHKKDASAIPVSDGFVRSRSGNLHPKKTTRGWKLLVEWADESTTWVDLKDLKRSNPVELAEYAIANIISHEPAFKWWVNNG